MLSRHSVNGADVESLIDCTKNLTKPQLISYLKQHFPEEYLLLAEQIELHDKVKEKLPLWAENACYVTRRSLEQCSSEATAKFKSSLIKGQVLIDLSAGLGVDDVAFSTVFKKVISIDADGDLNQLVRSNFNRLLIPNIERITTTAEAYLQQMDVVDAIFIDADRRPDGNTKVFTLADSTPDVLGLMPTLLKKSNTVMLKLSPMIDLTLLKKTFDGLYAIYVVSIKNEVKEVLALLSSTSQPFTTHAVELTENGSVNHTYTSIQTQTLVPPQEQGNYFYEPSNAIIKAGLTEAYAQFAQTNLVHKNSHYGTASHLVQNYFGRVFEVIHDGAFSKSSFNNYIQGAKLNKANVSARNFVTSVDEIRKTFKIKDGGDDYLFLTTDAAKNKLFWHCRKIANQDF